MADGAEHPFQPPDSTVARTWGGWLGNQVERAEGEAVVYTQALPLDELEAGTLLSLRDFHLGAEVVDTTQATGTRTHKDVVMRLAENEPPFTFVIHTRPQRPKAHGFCTLSYTQVWQDHFYIRPQELYDLNSQIERNPSSYPFGLKGRLLIRAVLFDELI